MKTLLILEIRPPLLLHGHDHRQERLSSFATTNTIYKQHDLASYINDSLKDGAQISQFRKDKIGQDRNGVSYWYDGNSVIGHRLYREVNTGPLKQKHRGKNSLDLQNTSLKWETLATNLDEFRKVLENLSSSQVGVEAAVQGIIGTEGIPVLEKIQKKKERDLKRRQKEEALLSGSHSYVTGVTRSCRTCRPVKYTFGGNEVMSNEDSYWILKKKKVEGIQITGTNCHYSDVVRLQ